MLMLNLHVTPSMENYYHLLSFYKEIHSHSCHFQEQVDCLIMMSTFILTLPFVQKMSKRKMEIKDNSCILDNIPLPPPPPGSGLGMRNQFMGSMILKIT